MVRQGGRIGFALARGWGGGQGGWRGLWGGMVRQGGLFGFALAPPRVRGRGGGVARFGGGRAAWCRRWARPRARGRGGVGTGALNKPENPKPSSEAAPHWALPLGGWAGWGGRLPAFCNQGAGRKITPQTPQNPSNPPKPPQATRPSSCGASTTPSPLAAPSSPTSLSSSSRGSGSASRGQTGWGRARCST